MIDMEEYTNKVATLATELCEKWTADDRMGIFGTVDVSEIFRTYSVWYIKIMVEKYSSAPVL